MNGEKVMENFGTCSAKSFIGRNVNLHLKDGAVIVNVFFRGIRKCSGKKSLIEYTLYRNRRITRIPLRSIAWAELLNSNVLRTSRLKS
jgi:hypothetical protein